MSRSSRFAAGVGLLPSIVMLAIAAAPAAAQPIPWPRRARWNPGSWKVLIWRDGATSWTLKQHFTRAAPCRWSIEIRLRVLLESGNVRGTACP